MLRRLVLPSLLAAVLLGGCVSVQATRIGTPVQYPAVPREHVLVYRTEDEVTLPFERIALLFVEGDADVTNERQMIDAARKKAGRLGANAVVLGEFRDPRMSTRIVGAIFNVPVQRRTQLLAIRLRTEGTAPADSAARHSR